MRALLVVGGLGLLAACTTGSTSPDDDGGVAASPDGGSSSGGSGTAGSSGAMSSSSGGSSSTSASTTPSSSTGTSNSAGASSGGGTSTGASSSSSGSPDAGSPSCPQGVRCVDTFPFHDTGNTLTEGVSLMDAYSCSPSTAEQGPEIVYRVTVPSSGFLSVAVYERSGVDVDVHILSARNADACVDRGNKHASADVTAGEWWIIADSYGTGTANAGDYALDIGFIVPSVGPCTMDTGVMPRVGDGGNSLAMPATGPIVLEAHLVTQEEPQPYPTTATEELAEHYALSQSRTGLVMFRSQVWAPLEGGSFYGAGIGSPSLFPVEHEGWYVNMYWTSTARPARGTRMILKDPGSNRAVVVAAGYETGPGNLSHIGGTPEETHFYMGTSHLSVLTLGIATDTSLPLGPRTCQ